MNAFFCKMHLMSFHEFFTEFSQFYPILCNFMQDVPKLMAFAVVWVMWLYSVESFENWALRSRIKSKISYFRASIFFFWSWNKIENTGRVRFSHLYELKYGFCKKLLWYKWTSDQLNTFFLTFRLQQKPSQKVRKKVVNWPEVHLYQSNFLQNP